MSTTTSNITKLTTIKTKEGYNSNDLSVVLRNEADNFEIVGWLWAHVAIKHTFNLLNQKLKVFQPKSRSDILEMTKSIKSVTEVLKDHEELEDKTILPWLKEKKPESIEILSSSLDKHHIECTEINKELEELVKSINDNIELKDKSSIGWSEILTKLQNNIQKQIELIFEHFYDEERIIVPLIISIPKSDQLKFADKLREVMQESPSAKFSLCAMFDSAKINDDLNKSLKKHLPWALRKVVVPVMIKASYKWFSDFIEIENNKK